MRDIHDASVRTPTNDVLCDYCIEKEIGCGGLGRVYRAHKIQDSSNRRTSNRGINKHYALKIGNVENEGFVLEQLAGINGVPKLYEKGTFSQSGDEFDYIITDYFAGRDFLNFIDGRFLSDDILKDVVCSVAQVLSRIHEFGYVHRDVKPKNIIVGKKVGLIDYGVSSKPQRAHQTDTLGGFVDGTLVYMDCRALRGEIDSKSDMFALGVVYSASLTGKHPFNYSDCADDEFEIYGNIFHQRPPIIETNIPDRYLIKQMLNHDPDKRPTAVEVVEMLIHKKGRGGSGRKKRHSYD